MQNDSVRGVPKRELNATETTGEWGTADRLGFSGLKRLAA